MPQPVLLDTDIGSDIDDLLALLYVLGSPELQLVGISTAYGDTTLRARLVHRVLASADLEIPIIPGATQTLSGRPIWYAGYEVDQAQALSASNDYAPLDRNEFLDRVIRPWHSELQLLAIAPLTNLATPPLATATADGSVKHVTVMGGDFRPDSIAEHNIKSDAVAAARVLSQPTPTTLIGLDQTLRVRLNRDVIHAATEADTPLTRFTRHEIDRWMTVNATDYILLHDPIAAATITHPGSFESTVGVVEIATSSVREGRTVFTPDRDGTTTLIAGFDTAEIESLILDRIRSGLELGA